MAAPQGEGCAWEVDLRVLAGAFRLEAAFQARARVVALYGPSGSGKSTLVEAIAGVRPAAGVLALDGVAWLGPGGAVPARHRRVGWVPQEAALFPHRTVAANLAWAAAGRRPDPRVVEVLGLGSLLDRRPGTLSGGERQRVALGRALCARPRLLLLDEPLSGVDLPRRARTFRFLLRVRDAFALPMLYVSHDPAEVLGIADHVVLLDGGRVVAAGRPEELLADAAALRLLDRLGFENVLRVRVAPGGRPRPGHAVEVRTPAGRTLVAPPGLSPEAREGLLGVQARDVLLAAREPGLLSARNRLPGRVASLEDVGDHVLVRVDAGDEWLATLTRRAVAELGLAPGGEVWVIVKTHSCHWLAS